eukprot:1152846-Pelagomonas_calceolata.AAC.1
MHNTNTGSVLLYPCGAGKGWGTFQQHSTFLGKRHPAILSWHLCTTEKAHRRLSLMTAPDQTGQTEPTRWGNSHESA